jgi:hypothetical protein
MRVRCGGTVTKTVSRVSPLFLIGLLTGCALEATSSHLGTPGMVEPRVQRDQNECIAQSIDGAGHDRGGLGGVNRESYRRCMEQRGYTLAETN